MRVTRFARRATVTFMPDHLSYLQFSKWYHLRINAQPDMGNLLFDEMDVECVHSPPRASAAHL